jgi:hypothetical protein
MPVRSGDLRPAQPRSVELPDVPAFAVTEVAETNQGLTGPSTTRNIPVQEGDTA